MDDEDEFETYFRRAAPVKQMSQQHSPPSRTPKTRRASLQAPNAINMTAVTKQRSLSPSSDISHAARANATPISPRRHSARRRCRKSPSDDVAAERRQESSSSSSTPASSTTSSWVPPRRHFDQASHSPRLRSRRYRRAQLKSMMSTPGDVIDRDESRSPPAGPMTVRQSRRATLAGDLLQIPPTFSGCDDVVDRRSYSASPPSSSPLPSPGPRPQRSSLRSTRGSRRAWSPVGADRSVAGYCKASSLVGFDDKRGQLVRSFMTSAKGIVNVENAVRSEKVYFDDEIPTGRRGRAAAVRQASHGRRGSTTGDQSPRRPSPQRVATAAAAAAATVCGETSRDASPRRRRSVQPAESQTEYKVLVVGDHGVGKTELICHFTTSYAASSFTSAVEDDEDVRSVTVAVDGQETRLIFVEYSSFVSPHMAPDNDVIRQADAYVVIYSMTDRSSYQWAYSFIDDVTQSRGGDDVKRPNLRSRRSMDVVVILVANKSDLVRKRQVSTEEAADACQLRRCKYVEVSATLGHRVDELLVGVAKQIQLMTRRLGSSGRQSSTSAAGACGSASGVNDNARSTRSPLWSTVGRIKAATRFVVRGLFGKPPSSCSDLMKP